ncbi:hypothetical protein KKC60_00205, partial [Patescibacteria group bacterium]|nr:hypothetical protein [Patescibacteria group bacterium]
MPNDTNRPPSKSLPGQAGDPLEEKYQQQQKKKKPEVDFDNLAQKSRMELEESFEGPQPIEGEAEAEPALPEETGGEVDNLMKQWGKQGKNFKPSLQETPSISKEETPTNKPGSINLDDKMSVEVEESKKPPVKKRVVKKNMAHEEDITSPQERMARLKALAATKIDKPQPK